MTHLKIDPVSLSTSGGYDVEIFGVDPASSDCLIGEIKTQHGGSAMWDINGRCRDHSTDCNLDVTSDDFVELERIARALVNPKYLD